MQKDQTKETISGVRCKSRTPFRVEDREEKEEKEEEEEEKEEADGGGGGQSPLQFDVLSMYSHTSVKKSAKETR